MTRAPSRQTFLILHGWQNHRTQGHWQHWLAGRLADLGHRVDYPQLPEPDNPDLCSWLDELDHRLGGLSDEPSTILCHSLACALWLHALARHIPKVRVERVLLVAPPSAGVIVQHPEIAAFAPPSLSGAEVLAAARSTKIVATDNDPYCPEGAASHYGLSLGLRTDVIRGAGHLDLAAGYGSWASVLDWCLHPQADVQIRGRTADAADRVRRASGSSY